MPGKPPRWDLRARSSFTTTSTTASFGYHALAAASLTHDEATPGTARGMPRHPIPAALLARLAVDTRSKVAGSRLGLVRDAMPTRNAADVMGIRVLLVHAIDDTAPDVYARHGFEPSPSDPLNLQILIKDLRAAVARAAGGGELPPSGRACCARRVAR